VLDGSLVQEVGGNLARACRSEETERSRRIGCKSFQWKIESCSDRPRYEGMSPSNLILLPLM